MHSDINVIYQDMPTSVKGFVRENPDTSQTIVLNPRLSYETQLRKLKHEVNHIRRGDLGSEASVQEIEVCAHGCD